eukprot:TRINITY_DN1535_c0_g1_i2.p1 TRINITY_DN1535_c0_g1~~TRINITY_DN1535_c0_g1_i2.p1  ORF type:complete len:259 (-),score=45.38 TRINITY_DN1535_c0_g1_i2:106-882(-)
MKNKTLNVGKFVGDITSFCNAFMALSAKNEIAIISSMQKGTSFIFPTPSMDQFRTNSSEYIAAMDAAITAFFEEEFPKLHSTERRGTMAAAAVSRGLCYSNRRKLDVANMESRMVFISCSPNVTSDYIPFMNCIFSCQKLEMSIDVLALHTMSCRFLEQACELTNGMFLSLEDISLMGKHLISFYLLDRESREAGFLVIPKPKKVDFRASCFCHQAPVDEVAQVCSVCLSIFCSKVERCSTCGSVFSQSKETELERKT